MKTVVIEIREYGAVLNREAQSFDNEGAAEVAFYLAGKVVVEAARLMDTMENAEGLNAFAKALRHA